MTAIGGCEVVRALILPNIGEYDRLILREAIEDDNRRKEAEMIVEALLEALMLLEADDIGMANGNLTGDSSVNQKMKDKVGDLVGNRVLELGRSRLVRAVLEA